MKISKKIANPAALILFAAFNMNFLFAQSMASLKAQFSSQSISSNSKIGQQANDTPDAQLAMSEASYPVTAGDIYTLAFAVGSTPVSYSIPVDSTYKIRIANLGVVNCKDLTYLELKNQVTGIVQKNYPMGGVQFVLTSPATFRVTITGEVERTVQKSAWALTRLSTFIKESFTPYSSTRNIKIISDDGEEHFYDLFLADRKGELDQDPYLRPGDKIVVNRISRRVTLSGAVERPGTYELLNGENLKELVDYYGNGLTALADLSRIELYRVVTGKADSGEKIYLNAQAYQDNYPLSCYDNVTISNFKDLMPVIFVKGAVNSVLPASAVNKEKSNNLTSDEDKYDELLTENSTEEVVFVPPTDDSSSTTSSTLMASNKITLRFNEGEDYAFFVRRNKEMFTTVSDLENAYVIRGNENIPLNLSKMLYDASYYSKVEMKYNDTLLVPFKQFFVSVSGAVYSPGRYPYIPDRTYEYYIGLAGGFVKEKNNLDAVTITDIDGKKHKKSEFIQPEMTIDAKANSGLYYFNQYAPVLTTILSAVSVSISVLAATGVIN